MIQVAVMNWSCLRTGAEMREASFQRYLVHLVPSMLTPQIYRMLTSDAPAFLTKPPSTSRIMYMAIWNSIQCHGCDLQKQQLIPAPSTHDPRGSAKGDHFVV
jgi:hypothetical protein